METGLTKALSVISKPKMVSGNAPTRVGAVPVVPPDPSPKATESPVMGQAVPPVPPQPVPVPPAPAVPVDKTRIGVSAVKAILAGLQETLRLADGAAETGWKCTGVTDSVFYQARVLRDRLAQFVATAKADDTLEISKAEVDAADKILGCSNEATAATPNKDAYILLGVLVAGAAIFLSIV